MERPFRRNAYYPPHRHGGLTTHLILKGELTIAYPEEKLSSPSTPNSPQDDKVRGSGGEREKMGNGKEASSTRETFGVGARIDVAANRLHEVWVGNGGCTYVVGE